MTDINLQALHNFQLFTGFKPLEIQILVDLAEEISFEPGAMIIQEGAVEDCMYILLEGSVEVSRKSAAQEVILAELQAATFFGEVALVDDGPRSATVRTTSKCLVLRIGRDTLRILAGVQPAAALHLLSAIGHSLVLLLRKSNQKYLDLLLSLQVPIDPEGKID